MILRSARLGLALFAGLALFLTGCSGGSGTAPGAGTGAASAGPSRTATAGPSRTVTVAPPRAPGTRTAAAAPTARGGDSGLPTVREDRLPAEARKTLALIRAGGPFPYAKDGAVFSNFERVLPRRERGHYHEYTVKTPGERDRGARRIVTGRDGEIYYTDDHYESFREVVTE
ncbi:ribonuclease domain-containing protein [Streptomyces sp. NPDC101115]|uniref:ribonuclease domain-containing protein n=1 Tax=Streptomyces sp. NPDC101115 TaxID=3366106 RepID=UPI00380A2988